MRKRILVVSIFAVIFLLVSAPVWANAAPPKISAVIPDYNADGAARFFIVGERLPGGQNRKVKPGDHHLAVQQSETRSTQPSSDSPRVEAPASERAQATASFVPPEHCVEDQKLAMAFGVVQVCVQRFSATHEFSVMLNEYRLRSSREDVVANEEIAAMAVDAHIAKLGDANEGQPGITLAAFEVTESPPAGRPNGADHCSTVWTVVIDQRVPGYEGEEFRIWAQTFVCARADSSDNSLQVVELRSSERFRVKTDRFKDRFEYLEPAGSALEAEQSLKMN